RGVKRTSTAYMYRLLCRDHRLRPRLSGRGVAPPILTVHAQTAQQDCSQSRSYRKTADKTKGGPFVMTHRSFVRPLAGTAIATLILAASAVPTMAQENKFKQVWVKTPDGLTISAQDWGNPTGPEIVFIHGFSQSHLSWIKQVT